MLFKYPEVLYALFFLTIPLLVHFFRLRKFQKESFTNVKILKKLSSESRRSSTIKKWLILCTRLLILTCIIFAFAQPYFPPSNRSLQEPDPLIYLDNSYSNQAIGPRGRLLERSIQDLLETLPEDVSFTLFTNDDEYETVTRSNLQEIVYSPSQLSIETLLLKAKNKFSKKPEKRGKLLIISDFQGDFAVPAQRDTLGFDIYALNLQPENRENISVDSALIKQTASGSVVLKVLLSATANYSGDISVSVHDGNELLGKSNVAFSEGNNQALEFTINRDEILNGSVQIEDNSLQFDNSLYFSLNRSAPIKITAINAADDAFLRRLYSSSDFEYNASSAENIDYNKLAAARVVILNEVSEIPVALRANLDKKQEENAVFIVIPPEGEASPEYSNFLKQLGVSGFSNNLKQEKLITTIKFQHPLFSEVFEEEIQNFEYPKVQSFYNLNIHTSPILAYEDQAPFLAEINGSYIFSAALNNNNTNFTRSPLVVPVFYNMGIAAIKPPQMYYVLGKANKIEIPVSLDQDEILQIGRENGNYIPQQQLYANKVEIFIKDELRVPGNYPVVYQGQPLQTLSFNIDRKENKPVYNTLSNSSKVESVTNLKKFLSAAGLSTEAGTLWKWFITFALFLLILETLLLKYFK